MSSRRSCPKPSWKRRKRTERTTGGRDEQAQPVDGASAACADRFVVQPLVVCWPPCAGDPRRPAPGLVAGRLDGAGRRCLADLVAGCGGAEGNNAAPVPCCCWQPPRWAAPCTTAMEPVRGGRPGAAAGAVARDVHPGDRADRPRATSPPPPAGRFLLDSSPRAHAADRPHHAGPRRAQTWRPASGRATLMVDGRLDGFSAGDRLRVLATLRRPSRPRNPGEFDFASLSTVAAGTVRIAQPVAGVCHTQTGATVDARRWLYGVRRFCQHQLEKYVQQPQSDWPRRCCWGRVTSCRATGRRISS
jgi:hypothetical protein